MKGPAAAGVPEPPATEEETPDTVSLDDLKRQYLALEAQLLASNNEIYWQQGRVLAQIKSELRHGKWLLWVQANLHIDERNVQLRLKVAALPSLPNTTISSLFHLSQVADIARKHNLSPDAAADRWAQEAQEQSYSYSKQSAKAAGKKRSRATDEPPSRRVSKTMTKVEAFAEFGIDTRAKTITEESLTILFKALRQRRHSDKGGKDADFIALTEAYKVLGGKS